MRLLLALLLVAGCKGKTSAPGGAGGVTEAAATAFAETLATAVKPCVADQLAALVEGPALAHQTARRTVEATGSAGSASVPPNEAAAIAARVMCAWTAGIDSYRLVRVRVVDGQVQPIMRRLAHHPASGALLANYDQLRLATSGDGKVRLVDAFSYRQGVWLSELVTSNRQDDALDFGGITDEPDEVHAIRDLVRNNQREEALERIDALPVAVRRERAVQMLRVNAAAGISPERYEQALDELAEAFPDDPAIALTELDGALSRDDHTAALRWLDMLEKEVGTDAFLDSTRAIVHVRSGDLDAALERASAAVAGEPELTRALEIQLDVLIAKKAWPDVLAVMTELEAKHGMRFDEAKLRAEPRLTELVALPAFGEWLAAR